MLAKFENIKSGYNEICTLDSEMFMDVGAVELSRGETYTSANNLERAILLVEGDVSLEYQGKKQDINRASCFDENPVCLHVPKDVEVKMTANDKSSLIIQAVENDKIFDSKLYDKKDTVSDVFGKDVLKNTSIRTVRTIIDDDIAPYSNLVIGEVVNHPGKWSSYPPHLHSQPEVYHYRFNPSGGFGFSLIGEDAFKLTHMTTSLIRGGVVHPQCAAPGYAMYYVWMIPHKPKRWLKDRIFEKNHEWLLDKDAVVWEQK